jgi:hypothetical protein
VPVVSQKLREHFPCGKAFLIVVLQALSPRNLADRANRGTANLARSFCNQVCHGEDWIGVLIGEQVIIPKVGSCHMPMEILRLQKEHENISKEQTQNGRKFSDGIAAYTGRAFFHMGRVSLNIGGCHDAFLSKFISLSAITCAAFYRSNYAASEESKHHEIGCFFATTLAACGNTTMMVSENYEDGWTAALPRRL